MTASIFFICRLRPGLAPAVSGQVKEAVGPFKVWRAPETEVLLESSAGDRKIGAM
jgi:hypothetical protein